MEHIGLYRDDDDMVVRKSTNLKINRIRKQIYREFKCLNLCYYQYKIKKVNFLDVQMKNIYQPYKKINTNPVYIHQKSNDSNTHTETDI